VVSLINNTNVYLGRWSTSQKVWLGLQNRGDDVRGEDKRGETGDCCLGEPCEKLFSPPSRNFTADKWMWFIPNKL